MAASPILLIGGLRVANDDVLPTQYALVLLRKLSDDDTYRALYEKSPAQALREIGVPENLIIKLPPSYHSIKLASKLVFQTALYQVIDNVATICLCQVPPQVRLALGEGATTPFGSS